MIKEIQKLWNELDLEVKQITKNGMLFSILFGLFAASILITYHFYLLPILYVIGTILLKTSFLFLATFIILGVGFDKIKKQMA